jgi:hypothetical protein
VRRRRLLVWLAVLGSSARALAAEDLPLDLTWEAPPECASGEEVRAELGRIARVRPGRTVPRLVATGRIVVTGGTYRLTLSTEQEGVKGERSLSSTECRSLEREVTLVLAVAFGEGVEIVEPEARPAPATGESTTSPAAAPGESSTPPAVEGAKPPAPPAKPVASAPPREVRAAARRAHPGNRFRAAPFVGAGALFALLPSATPFGFVGAALGVRRLWVEPRVVWLPGMDDTLPRSVTATYDGLGGSVSACAAVPPYAWSFDACLGVDVWALRGRSTGATEGGSAVAPYVAGVATLGWQWPPRGGLRFGLDADVHVALGEPHFVVEGLGDVHHVPRASPGIAAKIVLSPGG